MFFGVSLQAQQLDDLLKKIDLKLKKDRKYLNLHYYSFQPEKNMDNELKSIPRIEEKDPCVFQFDDGISYRLVFLKGGIELDSLELLFIDEIKVATAEGGGVFGAAGASNVDTSVVLDFKDLRSLKANNYGTYSKLYNLVRRFLIENEDQEVPGTLQIRPDDEMKTSMGISSRDNKDFLSFARVNNPFIYPRETRRVGGGIRGGETTTPDHRVDVSFSRMAYSHKVMDFSLGNASAEISFEDQVLNLLPWQGMTLAAGFRLLMALDKPRDINNATYMDVNLAIRLDAGLKSLFEAQPYILSDSPVLNVPTSFVAGFSFTRPLSLPFINIYFAAGQEDYTAPNVILNVKNNNYGYYSNTQFESTMSFYWNSSDRLTSRFRVDIGMAYFDVVRATYNASKKFSGSVTTVKDDIMPVFTLHYNFVPSDNPLLGASFKVLDGVAKLKAWLKVFEISPTHTIRLETLYLSAPIMRDRRVWETEGGIMFQLRYRYGL